MNNFIVYCARVFIPKVLERGRFVCSDELSYTPIAGKPEDRNDPQRRGSSGNHPAVARPDETVSRIQCEMPRYHENSCFTPLESNFESSTMFCGFKEPSGMHSSEFYRSEEPSRQELVELPSSITM